MPSLKNSDASEAAGTTGGDTHCFASTCACPQKGPIVQEGTNTARLTTHVSFLLSSRCCKSVGRTCVHRCSVPLRGLDHAVLLDWS